MLALLILAMGVIAPKSTLAQEAAQDEAPPSEDIGPDPAIPWWQWRNTPAMSAQMFGPMDYQQFWDVRKEVFAHPDNVESALRMPTVMAGDVLKGDQDALQQMKATGQAQVVVVENNPVVTYGTEDEFVVFDTYINRSYMVDMHSGQPLGPGPDVAPEEVSMAYHIKRGSLPQMPGLTVWQVVDSVQIAQ